MAHIVFYRFPRRFEPEEKDPDDGGDIPIKAEAVMLDSVKLTISSNDVDGLYGIMQQDKQWDRNLIFIILPDPNPDAMVTLPYFKYFMLQDMLVGGSNLAAQLSMNEYALDTHFHYFSLGVSLNNSPNWLKVIQNQL